MADREMPSLEEVKKKVAFNEDGLSGEEARKRKETYGLNEIEEKKTNIFLKLLTYFWGPIPWMLEAAVILSAIVGHWPDFFILLVLLVSNSLIGFYEEWTAGNEIEALKAKLSLKARVKRDGKWVEISSKEVVPGDIIRLRAGDIVPADACILEGDPVEVDQSVLTGESLPATAEVGKTVYSGSVVKQGESTALVYGTGDNTYFGKTAQLVQEAHTVSHFQRAVIKIGNYLILLTAGLVSVIVIFAIVRGDPLLSTIQFAMVLTIAGIPVAMPTVLSVTMAIGARSLAKKQVIVTKLVAIEELAGVDVLCTDKTGTLTQNTLTLGESFTLNGLEEDKLLEYAALASREDDNDAIDNAIFKGLKGAVKGKVTHFSPFDPVNKRTEAEVKEAEGTFKVSKGAPQVILELIGKDSATKDEVEKAVNDFASKGYRALGVAKTDDKGEWKFLGLLSLFDPPREEAKSTIAMAEKMGIKVKMITGDQAPIARETAKTLGMGDNILEAKKLDEGGDIDTADGFAQVFPEHKFKIVEDFQKEGHIVGMTGDGVNDAPALKKADCGIAVSGATDTARAAASIALLGSGLDVIIDAVKESRKIFQRMNSYVLFRISETLCVVIFMTLAILAFNFYPLNAVMIVMLALLNDGAILSIAYDNVKYGREPEVWKMKTVLGISTMLGVLQVVIAFGLFYLCERVFHLDRSHTQTMMYLYFSISGHLTIFITRTKGPFWSTRPANILLGAVCGTQALATVIAAFGFLMTGIGFKWALFIWGYSLSFFLIEDVIKLFMYKVLCFEKR